MFGRPKRENKPHGSRVITKTHDHITQKLGPANKGWLIKAVPSSGLFLPVANRLCVRISEPVQGEFPAALPSAVVGGPGSPKECRPPRYSANQGSSSFCHSHLLLSPSVERNFTLSNSLDNRVSAV